MNKPFAMIIEDDRDSAALYRHVMDLAGFRTEIVFHGQTALERLSNSLPDLVILDLNLPGLSGAKILEFIRAGKRLAHTRVLVITGFAHLLGGLTDQPDLVLQKPISIEQLTGLAKRITLANTAPKARPFEQRYSDAGTGLYNQPFFLNRLESSLKQAKEITPYLFAVLLFKLEPKDKQGRAGLPSWEAVLQEIAVALRSILRPTDTIARFGSDTFYLLFENIPNGDIAVRIADRIQAILRRKVTNLEDKIKLPIRIGILVGDAGYETVEMILNDAKFALVLAASQGDEYTKYYYQISLKK